MVRAALTAFVNNDPQVANGKSKKGVRVPSLRKAADVFGLPTGNGVKTLERFYNDFLKPIIKVDVKSAFKDPWPGGVRKRCIETIKTYSSERQSSFTPLFTFHELAIEAAVIRAAASGGFPIGGAQLRAHFRSLKRAKLKAEVEDPAHPRKGFNNWPENEVNNEFPDLKGDLPVISDRFIQL